VTGSNDVPGPLRDPGGWGPAGAQAAWHPAILDALGVLVAGYGLGGLASSGVQAQFDGALADAVALTSVAAMLGVVAVAWSLARCGVAGLRAVLGPRPTARHLAVAVTVGVAVGGVCNVGLPPLLEVLLDQVGLEPPTVQQTHRRVLTASGSRVAAVVGVLAIAPLGEELLFRGLAFRALRRHLRAVAAVAASAVLFAAVHLPGTGLLGAAFLVVTLGTVGVALAALVERQRHLWGAVVAHAAFNAVGVGVIVIP
jgi:membrane protease YdiL (CAAX protease family)